MGSLYVSYETQLLLLVVVRQSSGSKAVYSCVENLADAEKAENCISLADSALVARHTVGYKLLCRLMTFCTAFIIILL